MCRDKRKLRQAHRKVKPEKGRRIAACEGFRESDIVVVAKDMTRQFLTILLLLVFGGLPIAAQVYQVSAGINEALVQASEEGETMACCQQAGHCQMSMPVPTASPTTDCPTQCACAPSEPILPANLATSTLQAPFSEEAPLPPAPSQRWGTIGSPGVLRQPPILSSRRTYLRHTCLRI